MLQLSLNTSHATEWLETGTQELFVVVLCLTDYQSSLWVPYGNNGPHADSAYIALTFLELDVTLPSRIMCFSDTPI